MSYLTPIDDAIRQFQPVAVLSMFSGGDDSLTATVIASQHPQFDYAVHLNTGIGLPETRQFVRGTCSKYGWRLREYFAKEDCGQDYEQIVAQYGFPGPAAHSKMYIRLKERPIKAAMREAKKGHHRRSTVLLISGARSSESDRRMGYAQRITKLGSQIWLNLIMDWSKADCLDYLNKMQIERSPVVQKIHKSGECLCGAFASPGEFEELKFWYPEYANYIASLETPNGKPWGWGANRIRPRKPPGIMCQSCQLNLSFGETK